MRKSLILKTIKFDIQFNMHHLASYHFHYADGLLQLLTFPENYMDVFRLGIQQYILFSALNTI